MAKAYSDDLRRKFLQAYDRKKGTLGQVAGDFGVSEGWAKKISARRTRTGQVERPPWRRGPESCVTDAVQEWLRAEVRRQADVTLRELQDRLQAVRGMRLSIGRLWQVLRQLGLRLKKSHSMPKSKKRRKRSSVAKRGGKR
jgi:transposase